MLEILGTLNIGVIIAAVVFITIFFLVIRNMMKSGGRSDEENTEEDQTQKLFKDEKKAKKLQKDEKNQCSALDKVFTDIMATVVREKASTADLESLKERISRILQVELGEKMSIKKAFEMFKELDGLIAEFIDRVPFRDEEISKNIAKIVLHKKTFYDDLIEEANVEGDKKKLSRMIYEETDNEIKGDKLAA